MTQKIVLASNNPGKIREIQAILKDRLVVPQSELDVPEADETGTTFVENAIIKARNAAHYSGLPAIADDSGLEVDALFGAPGVHSARYANVGAGDQHNLEKLLEDMTDIPDDRRTARFRCVIVFLRHEWDPCPLIAQGSWEGIILREPRGSQGFGYDPVFYLPNEGCASAELRPDEKNCLSHRGKALRALARMLQNEWIVPDDRLFVRGDLLGALPKLTPALVVDSSAFCIAPTVTQPPMRPLARLEYEALSGVFLVLLLSGRRMIVQPVIW